MGKSSIKLAFLVVLVFAAVMTFSAAVSRADGTVFLPCKSDSDCEAIECVEGAAVCVNNNCHCDSKVESILASDCKHDEDCVKFP